MTHGMVKSKLIITQDLTYEEHLRTVGLAKLLRWRGLFDKWVIRSQAPAIPYTLWYGSGLPSVGVQFID